jgi:hypothetical protein
MVLLAVFAGLGLLLALAGAAPPIDLTTPLRCR